MEDTYVICIARQYGSGGHVIGKILSRMLGLDYYDKELITQAAKKSGICPNISSMRMKKLPVRCRMHSLPGFFPEAAYSCIIIPCPMRVYSNTSQR